MAIFLDTGKMDEIKKYNEMGIIRGVTTNPTILVKDGVTEVVRFDRCTTIRHYLRGWFINHTLFIPN